MAHMIQGRPLVPGAAQGEALVSSEPLSFWGGYDQHSGEIIDRRHELSGCIAAARVLAIPSNRGSSTTTAVLLEAMRNGTAPAAILTSGVDAFFALASIVASELYARSLPVVALQAQDFASLHSGQWINVQADGSLIIHTSRPDL
jgi:predicted aconitase with swiveling domain